jgi:hypothetical protein
MGHNPNAAAQIGDKEVLEADITTIGAAIGPLVGQSGELKRTAVVNWMTAIAIIETALESAGASVPAETVAAVQAQDQVLVELKDQPGVIGEFSEGYATILAATQGYAVAADGNPLDMQILVDGVNAVEVEVNPKYGNWNEDNLALDGSTGSLSESVAGLGAAVPAE